MTLPTPAIDTSPEFIHVAERAELLRIRAYLKLMYQLNKENETIQRIKRHSWITAFGLSVAIVVTLLLTVFKKYTTPIKVLLFFVLMSFVTPAIWAADFGIRRLVRGTDGVTPEEQQAWANEAEQIYGTDAYVEKLSDNQLRDMLLALPPQ